MANQALTNQEGKFVEVTYEGTGGDWDYKTNGGFQHEMLVKSIQWVPSGADTLVINNGGIDGASIVHMKATAATDFRVMYFNAGTCMKPYIDFSDCTFVTCTATKIIFELV